MGSFQGREEIVGRVKRNIMKERKSWKPAARWALIKMYLGGHFEMYLAMHLVHILLLAVFISLYSVPYCKVIIHENILDVYIHLLRQNKKSK